ncbi:HAMP domain-containing protein [Epibacterium sp. SM1979]|uniref:HAMP domain-containing protein n=1 Tax=Tritonibacter litoralis TaxID=2662264 RepID=A0A843YG54_9RHOB|nr:methyl-accepting chemotaxis protein [Tritonibacter litoralis]MQQ09841.1 HAMP domain-containing protein [Tritonibacter litoralis]
MPFQIRSISGKLLVTITLAVAVLGVCFTAFTVQRVSKEAHNQALEKATNAAFEVAQDLTIELTQATTTAISLSGSVGGLLKEGDVTTQDVSELLKGVAEQFGAGFFTWAAAIPGGPADTQIQGTEGRNSTGTFTPYWTRNDTGELTFETFDFDPNTSLEWYRVPVDTRKGLITEPYLSSEKRLLTSVSVPVIVGGEVVALAGTDLVLDDLTNFVTSLSVFDGGQVMLLGQSGKWLAHHDNEKITQAYDGPGVDAYNAALETGETQVVSGLENGVTRLFQPFTASGMNKTWVVVLDVPRHVFTDPVRESVKQGVISIGLLLALVLGTTFFATRSLVQKPLSKLLNAVNALSDGRVKEDIDLPQSTDEIGVVAVSLDKLRHGLVEKERLEEERVVEEENHKTVVQSLASGLNQLASGDLTSKLNQSFPEHYEQLRRDFNKTVDTLNETMSQVVASTQSIRNGATEISQSSDDLSHRTESQAATLEQTAAALDQLTASVKSAANRARDVEQTMTSARDEAENNREVVQSAVTAMTEIEQSSNHISQIISVIDDIAFQTNLLALNAGVEAARAGEAGRGFAVVASEVRALAQRSADSATEIKTLIGESSQQVERGVDLVGKAGGALQNVVQQISQISQLVSGIAEGAAEQSIGLNEINTGVIQLDQVTQQNAAMVEESTAAGHMLNADASKLADIVAHFKVSDANNGASALTSRASAPASSSNAGDWEVDDAAAMPQALGMAQSGGAEAKWADF